MKPIYNRALINFLWLLLALSSCKKFLDEKPDKSLAEPNSLEALQSLLDNSALMNYKNPSWGEASADNYFLRDVTYNFVLSPYERLAYTWQTKDYLQYPNDWSLTYDVVYVANTILENIEKIERTQQNSISWDNMKGAALLFRAKSFLQAVWIFSKAYDESTADQDYGIALKLSTDFSERPVRATVRETYDRILQDLNEAATILSPEPTHPMRPSRPAAYAYLARTYLSMRKYDKALEYADKCLELKHDLLNYNDIELVGTYVIPRFNKEVIMNSVMFGNYLNVSPLNARVDPTLLASYENDDLRKSRFFRNAAGGQMFRGSYAQGPLFDGVAVDEMYLTRAECYARNGNTDDAMADLNTLMINRWSNLVPYPNFVATDALDALNQILEERRKELIFRGLRWMDIKRLNKEGANIVLTRNIGGQTYELLPNDERYALPLPLTVINMTGMPQN